MPNCNNLSGQPKGDQLLSHYFVVDGQFGAYMQVHIQNDGPVTIYLESPHAPIDAKQVYFLVLGVTTY